MKVSSDGSSTASGRADGAHQGARWREGADLNRVMPGPQPGASATSASFPRCAGAHSAAQRQKSGAPRPGGRGAMFAAFNLRVRGYFTRTRPSLWLPSSVPKPGALGTPVVCRSPALVNLGLEVLHVVPVAVALELRRARPVDTQRGVQPVVAHGTNHQVSSRKQNDTTLVVAHRAPVPTRRVLLAVRSTACGVRGRIVTGERESYDEDGEAENEAPHETPAFWKSRMTRSMRSAKLVASVQW